MNIYITPSQYEEAAKIGISPSQLNQRVRQGGWEIERAITTPMGVRQPNKYTQLARKNGISPSTYATRVHKYGWKPEKAATVPPEKHNQWDKWLKVADRNGVARTTFYHRMKYYGWEPEKAATTPTTPNDGTRRKVTFKAAGRRGITG